MNQPLSETTGNSTAPTDSHSGSAGPEVDIAADLESVFGSLIISFR